MALRLAYRLCYVLLLASGRVAARLAGDFRVLGEARERVGPLTVVLQLPVVAGWLPARPISLAAFSACCALAPRLQAPSA
ncbi:MAG TPA: hypothetical protein VKB73_09465 [Gaiellaceae bacterium]|nr:hypothetical protein [Gaiellaceae bacterium]